MYFSYDEDKDFSDDGVAMLRENEGVPTLEDMQLIVGGLIEPIDLFSDEDGVVSMYLNEEGLYLYESPSVYVDTPEGFQTGQYPRGPFVIVRCDNNGDTVGLKDSDFSRFVFGEQHLISFSWCKMIPILEIER